MASIKRAPIMFRPYLKSVIWGGVRICRLKGLSQQPDNIGESWEISQLPGYESIVAEGEYKNLSINNLIQRFGAELLGEEVVSKYGSRFPLLVKFIDANNSLSLQVHPDNDIASERHGGFGKTEMWYIISAEEGAKIYAGLKERLTPEEYHKKVEDDSFLDAVTCHDSRNEDVYFLPPGTVHSIGAGNFLAEIQESSDITYRIYDYNRKDKDGNPRELHTLLAKDAINYEADFECRKSEIEEKDGVSVLVDCEPFTTHRIRLNGEKHLKYNKDSFKIAICTEGEVTVKCEEGSLALKAGFSALIPAIVSEISLSGKGTLLITGLTL